MPLTCWGTRWVYPPEPLIKNYELWLDWQAHQLDTPHWWEELTTIPEAGDQKKLAWKICTSFDILVVRCQALWNQDYTRPLLPNALPGVGSSPVTILTKMSDEALTADPGLHSGTAILGRGSQSTNIWWSLPFGTEFGGIEAACGEVPYL